MHTAGQRVWSVEIMVRKFPDHAGGSFMAGVMDTDRLQEK